MEIALYASIFTVVRKYHINEWMCKLMLEVSRQDGLEYPPNTLYSIACWQYNEAHTTI